MTRLASLTAGQIVRAGYRDDLSPSVFLGFTDNIEKYSTTPAFDSLKALKAAKGAKNAADLVAAQDAAGEYGFHFYAMFKDLEGDYVWGAYLYNGRWSVGTSADALKVAAA